MNDIFKFVLLNKHFPKKFFLNFYHENFTENSIGQGYFIEMKFIKKISLKRCLNINFTQIKFVKDFPLKIHLFYGNFTAILK